MQYPIGSSIAEGVSNAASPFTEDDRYTLGLVMTRERGVPNKAIRVSSLQEDKTLFGGHIAGSYGSHVVENLFANAGAFGARLYGVRIVGSGSSAAAKAVTYGLGAGIPSIIKKVGVSPSTEQHAKVYYTVKNVNVGDSFTIGGKTFVATVASPEHVIKNLADLMAADSSLSSTYTIGYSGAQMFVTHKTINTAIPLTHSVDPVVDPTGGTAATASGTANAIGSNGDTVSIYAETPNGTTFLGTYLKVALDTTVNDVAAGIASAINDGTGSHGFSASSTDETFTITAPVSFGAGQNGLAVSATVTGTVDATGGDFSGGVNQSVVPVSTTLMTISAGQYGELDPGNWGNGLSAKIHPYGSRSNGMYSIEVLLNNERVEEWQDSTLAGIVSMVNSNSKYVVISSYNEGHAPTSEVVAILSGGVYVAPDNEADFYPVQSELSPKSFGCFDGLSISLIAQTEFFTETIAVQMRDYAQRTRRIAVFTAPYLASENTIQSFAGILQTSSVISRHIAMYALWGEVADGSGGWKWIPALGAVLGAGFLRVPQMNNDQIWFPPAGMDSVVTGFRKVYPETLSQDAINTYVRSYTTNIAVTRPGKGTYFYSSRTMSTNSLFHSIHISRLTNYLLNVMEEQYEKVLQKPNTPELRNGIVSELTMYFKGLYEAGALERTIPFSEAFKVVCDLSNNPLGGDRKQLTVDIYWIPAECVEAIRINLNRNDGALVATLGDVETT